MWDRQRTQSTLTRILATGIIAVTLHSCTEPTRKETIEGTLTITTEPLPCETPPPEPLNPEDMIETGIHYLREKKWAKAYDVFAYSSATPTTPKDEAFTLWAIAWSSHQQGNEQQSIGQTTAQLLNIIGPPTPENKQHLERTTTLLEALVTIYPMNYTYHADLGTCRTFKKEYQSALPEFITAIDLWPLYEPKLYAKLVNAYLLSHQLHKILDVETQLHYSTPTIVMSRLLDHVDETLHTGISITHDSSNTEVTRGFAELFDALGTRMNERGTTARALQYYCMTATNKYVLGEPPTTIKEYLQERYDDVNEKVNGQLRPLPYIYKNSMKGNIQSAKEKEVFELLKE